MRPITATYALAGALSAALLSTGCTGFAVVYEEWEDCYCEEEVVYVVEPYPVIVIQPVVQPEPLPPRRVPPAKRFKARDRERQKPRVTRDPKPRGKTSDSRAKSRPQRSQKSKKRR